ncbi:DNA-binding protein [Paenisporosarcina cavernae]|uniref:DNA-binding protein n=1 Tax=Paenisporosarcina cavernae TaxID=2320858 RepID=A0A385YY06_9BACL|nr:DNA-binding protein [Paenisporosarcina cavernae]AYC30498.1 DNA-binding protein [Paenisporosarcina cavernae]
MAKSDFIEGSDLPKGLSKPAIRALVSKNWTTLHELSQHTEEEVAALHGMGPKVMGALKIALRKQGLDFREK